LVVEVVPAAAELGNLVVQAVVEVVALEDQLSTLPL
jgi:hypothetical protein